MGGPGAGAMGVSGANSYSYSSCHALSEHVQNHCTPHTRWLSLCLSSSSLSLFLLLSLFYTCCGLICALLCWIWVFLTIYFRVYCMTWESAERWLQTKQMKQTKKRHAEHISFDQFGFFCIPMIIKNKANRGVKSFLALSPELGDQ